jgi:zinc protease
MIKTKQWFPGVKRLKKYLVIFNIVFVLNVFGQTGDTNSFLDRSIPPKTEKLTVLIFPHFYEKTLPNGLEIITTENHNQPTVSIIIGIKGGAFFDGSKSGTASLVAELLTKGTKTKKAADIAEQLDFLGADLYCSTTWDEINISLTVLKKFLNPTLDIFTDCILNSVFPEEELVRIKEQRLGDIKRLKNEPGYLSGIKFSNVIFKGHPYGNPVDGDEKSIPKIKRNDIIVYYKKYFTPDNTFCIISGDITMDEMYPFFMERFNNWNSKTQIKWERINVKKPINKSVYIIDRPGSVQSSIRIGTIGIPRNHPDFFGLTVLNTYLGGYFRSQLNLNLREKNSYTYEAGSYLDTRKFEGPFVISTEVGMEVTANAVDEIFKEVELLSMETISKERFLEVKNFLTGSFPLSLQRPLQVATFISNIKLYNLPDDYYNNFFNNINKVTEMDIKELAKKYINKENLAVIIAGDSKKIMNSLKKFGRIEVFNADGKKISK